MSKPLERDIAIMKAKCPEGFAALMELLDNKRQSILDTLDNADPTRNASEFMWWKLGAFGVLKDLQTQLDRIESVATVLENLNQKQTPGVSTSDETPE